MIGTKNLIRLELARLFRKSNVLFFFLFAYVLMTPVGRFASSMSEKVSALVLYKGTVESMSLFGLLMIAIFMANNIGNEFNEGSYRKMLALGLEKQDYFQAKLFLVFFMALCITTLGIGIFILLGLFVVDGSLTTLISGLSFAGVFCQFTGLVFIGLFGLFLILFFRNRTLGLVFFPFWFFTEFFAYMFAQTNTNINLADYMPGILSWTIHNNQVDNGRQLLMLTVYSTLFVTAAWYGLVLREEK